ncbi:fimbrial protein [Chromobacterium haemolyticum]|uniref:fimbrial protein n=1 Tax=Chromobacterium haemolyticum TaxID=394935 RepID=UPI0013B3D687|nr:fimbrial protein [Chromobacterium haemolyticum]
MHHLIKIFIFLAGSALTLLCKTAAAGPCYPSNGTPQFSFSFNKDYNTTAEAPSAGTVLVDAYSWDLGRNYEARCFCQGQSSLNGPMFYTTASAFPLGQTRLINGANIQFYQLNDYVQVGVEMFMAGNIQRYLPTPWYRASNELYQTVPCNNDLAFADTYRTGSKGRLHLLISRRFVGTVTVPRITLLQIYGSDSHSEAPLFLPMTELSMSLSVTVPQNCSLAEGQPRTFDFGTLSPADVASPNEAAKNMVSRSFWIQCSNIAAGVKINLSLEGHPSQQSPLYLSSSLPDVALSLTSDGRLVVPTIPGLAPTGLQLIPFQYYPQLQGGELKLEAWPVKMRPLPAPGAFQGSATIRFDYE